MDPDTFDRCDGNEDAINDAFRRRHRKNLAGLVAATGLIRATLGNDFMDDMDYDFEDFSDEEFND